MFPTGKKCRLCGRERGCVSYGIDCCSLKCSTLYMAKIFKVKPRKEYLGDSDAWWNDPDQLCDK